MRNPERIKEFCNELAEIWETNVPQWRFGQLICNVFGTLNEDPFFPEEDRMIKIFKDYFNKNDY
jgi:hypothetical protein